MIRSGRLAIFLRKILNPVQSGEETPPVRPPKQPEPRPARIRNRMSTGRTLAPPHRGDEIHLANARTTALDQNTQHDDEQGTGSNPDEGNIFHIESPFSQ